MHFFKPLTRRQMALGFISLTGGLLLCCALQWCCAQLDTGAAVRADTLRLHVRADSDTIADQTVKLRVRDAILTFADENCPHSDKAAALAWAARSLPRIELKARCALAGLGAGTQVRVRLVNMYFDAARYSGAALPAGRYDALRVELGDEGRSGKNWWCVLYPGLCRAACGGYALPEENDLICGEYILRFAVVDWWQRQTAPRGDETLIEL